MQLIILYSHMQLLHSHRELTITKTKQIEQVQPIAALVHICAMFKIAYGFKIA